MTDKTGERICRACGKPTSDLEFYTVSSERVWVHMECMREEARKRIASGEVDDLRIAVKWPDGIHEICSSRQLRMQLREETATPQGGQAAMSDDNIVDITGQLPPPDLHTRWQKRLPDYYLMHMEPLKALFDEVGKAQKSLRAIHKDWSDAVGDVDLNGIEDENRSKRRHARDTLHAMQRITEALVLLDCAQGKLEDALPAEVFMARRDIRDVEMDLEKGRSP